MDYKIVMDSIGIGCYIYTDNLQDAIEKIADVEGVNDIFPLANSSPLSVYINCCYDSQKVIQKIEEVLKGVE